MNLHCIIVRAGVMGLVRTTILAGAVALGLGLILAGFGLAYLVISAYHPWPE